MAPESADVAERDRMRAFALIWVGQLVSLIGSALTAFVLGVWVYQLTGSVTQFALISFSAVLPGIVASPLAGVLTDRADRRRLMLLGDCGAGFATAAVAVLLITDQLAVWHIYLATAIAAVFNTLHTISYTAMVPTLVPKRHLGRVNGLMQVVQAAQIAAPLVAGVLVGTIGIRGVITIDLVTFGCAVATLLLVRLPRELTTPAPGGTRDSMWRDAGGGFGYLRRRPALLWLVGVFGAFNFLFSIAGVLVQPLILSFSSPATLGMLMFAGGSGLFAGSLVMGAWGGPRRKIQGVYLALVLGGVFLGLHSVRPSPWLIAVLAPAFLFQLPIMNACAMTLVQTKVASDKLGRVLAATRVVALSAMPVAYLAAGPLADALETLMRADGTLAGSVGSVIGVGQGRGIALVFAIAGAAMLVLAAVAFIQPRLRGIDTELPDAAAHPKTGPAEPTPEPAEPVAVGVDRQGAP